MTNRMKTKSLSTAAGVIFVTSLALGISGCSGNARKNRTVNGMNPYSSQYGQNSMYGQRGLYGQGQNGLLNNNRQYTNQSTDPNRRSGTRTGLGTDNRLARRGTEGSGDQRANTNMANNGNCAGNANCGKGEPSDSWKEGYKAGMKGTSSTNRDFTMGENEALRDQIKDKNDPNRMQAEAENRRLKKLLALNILEEKTPAWDDGECRGSSTSGDLIPDECKEQVGLQKDQFYGYRAAAVAIDKAHMKAWLKQHPTNDNFSTKVKKFFAQFNEENHSSFNRKLAKIITRSGGDISESSVSILQELVQQGSYFMPNINSCAANLDPARTPSEYDDECASKDAWIQGGYDEPLLFNPADGVWNGEFNSAQLSGVGSNTRTLGRDEKFVYVVEGYLNVKRKKQIALASLLGTVASRRAGGFFVFINGNLEVTNLGLGENVTKLKGEINPPRGNKQPLCPPQFTMAVVFEDSKEAANPIREQVVMKSDKSLGENTWELMPQEIAMPKPPKGCEGRYKTSIIDALIKGQKS